MLITAGRLLTGDTEITDGALLLEGEAIVAAGPRALVEAQAKTGVRRMEFSRSTIMPGLIDAHVHLVFDGSADPVDRMRRASDERLLAGMRKHAVRLLTTGVTTVRDLGDRNGVALRLADEIAKGFTAGPRIVSSGTPLTAPGGHGWYLGGEVTGPEAACALVERNVAAGARVIKVMAGGGHTQSRTAAWQSQFGARELSVIVKEAHAARVKVAAHAHGAQAIADAVRAGVDTLEHCRWTTVDGFDLRLDVLDRIVKRGIHVCPAIDPEWQTLPQTLGTRRATALLEQVGKMAEAGVKLIAGTDAGTHGVEFGGLAESLGVYEYLGLPPQRILAMATTEAAAALGIADHVGRLAPGYTADLLVLDDNPLTDLSALSRPHTVVTRGLAYRLG
ncbi:amidohydrolase family protein [Streptomyces sp. NPDC047023]|uniref:amidohydrolase family protein n=1 Tax=Streptomyces sp. NPDC047023 TaxID=3155139 RepID=UPI0033F6B3DC